MLPLKPASPSARTSTKGTKHRKYAAPESDSVRSRTLDQRDSCSTLRLPRPHTPGQQATNSSYRVPEDTMQTMIRADHSLGTSARLVRVLAAPAASSPDLSGRTIQHKILVIAHYNEDTKVGIERRGSAQLTSKVEAWAGHLGYAPATFACRAVPNALHSGPDVGEAGQQSFNPAGVHRGG